MVKCPFCQFDNEDGALFCEQCKSDLAGVEPVGGAMMAAATLNPGDEEVPMAAVLEDTAPYGSPMPMAEPIIMATPMNTDSAFATIPVATPIGEDVAPAPVEESPILPPPDLPSPLASPLVETATPEPITATPVVESPPAAPFPAAFTMPSEPAAAPPLVTPSAPVTAQPPAVPPGAVIPPGTTPKLVVLRGVKINVEYPIYEGHNFIGRADEKPVDIDLEDQEPPDRVWSSRQHALITFENNEMVIEDLNSSNGTFVNRTRVYPGQKRPLQLNDVIQIGTVQMKVKA